jgi:hypothetical protein
MGRREHFDAGHGNPDFVGIMRSGFGDDYEEHSVFDYVECDNCGRDVHMDDAKHVRHDPSENLATTSNYYCGDECLVEGIPRMGKIGPEWGR